MTNNLPQIIREGRKAKGLSQQQVANRLEVHRLRVTDWESGRVALKADDLLRLAKLLNIDLNSLVENHAIL